METYTPFGDVVVVMHDVSGQSEVADLHDLALRQKDIPGSQVPMNTLQNKKTCCSDLQCFNPTSDFAPAGTNGIYFCVYFISARFILNAVLRCPIKRGLCVNMPVGGMALTTGYLGIITMKLNEKPLAAACPCLVILALAVLLLYSALSLEWSQRPSWDCLSDNC